MRRPVLIVIPTGTVTFLFTDIEGSTRLWEQHAPEMQADVARHDELLKQCVETNRGYVFKTVGDAFCAAFRTASEALTTALEAQAALGAEPWQVPDGIKVRMALHTGTAEERDGDYFGPTLNRIARLISVGHGGQILVSLVASELLRDVLPERATLVDLGTHRLKDLMRPESVYQITYPGLRADFPPLKSLDNHPNNLPPQPTPFIDREKELGMVQKFLLRDEIRIVTLTGVGGTGKTRLGLQVTANLADKFADGVYLVDLSVVDSPQYIVSAIARTLDIRETGGKPLIEMVKDAMHDKRMLLLMDNFEHLIAGAPLVAELLSFCPGLKILATSREGLHLRGEQIIPVSPLAAPKVRGAKEITLPQLRQYDAVSLFIERAIAARVDFMVTNESAPAVAEICARLDGLPLAIELAAAWVIILAPLTILAHLGSQLKLLNGGYSDLPPRQRTLRATIDWSYMLLSPAEQMIFREVSVFSGGSSLEAMELVCACGADSGIDVLGTLASLVAKNLLFRVENDGDEQRFKMIALIREYGLELLKSSGTEKEIRDAHARYFLEVAEKTESDLTGPKQKEAFDRLEAEHDNFQTALEWLHEKEDGELELRLCGALRLYWQVRGYLSEGRENCRRALVRQERPTLRVRAGARLCAGTLAREQGDYTAAVEALEQAIKEYRDGKNAFGMSMALYELGMSLYRKGDLTGATERFKGARKSCASSDIIVQALADKGFGLVAEKEGRLDDAWAYFEKCRKVFSQVGDDRLLAQVVNNLANIYHGKGEYRKALESCKEALELSMKVRDETYIAYFLNNMGFFHSVLGEHDQALKSYESLRVIAARMGNRRMLALSYAGLADALLALGDRERALSDAQESVQLSERVGAGMELGVGLRSLGEVHLACGNLAAARQCFSRSIPLLEKFIELDDQEDLKRAQIGYKISVREM